MNQAEQLAMIDELHGLFTNVGTSYWLFGGWAVDFHVGRVTRDHADIDLAVWRSDLEQVRGALDAAGWSLVRDSPAQGFAEFAHGPARLDLTWIDRDAATGAVYTPLAEGRGSWPMGSFGSDVAELAGVRATVVSLDSLVTDKSEIRSDAAAARKDRADVSVLKGFLNGC
jgi:hypothetical protein